MPSGRIHDRITYICLPGAGLLGYWLTQQWPLTGVFMGGFLFGGLMFGPDLDVRSVQSRRWGWLAWIWRPYRDRLRHRSWLSHGPLAGTLGRVLYLTVWLAIFLLLGLEVSNAAGYTAVTWAGLWQGTTSFLWRYRGLWLTLLLGIECGAMSHSLSDWLVSAWKRSRRTDTRSALKRTSRRSRRSRPPRSRRR